MILSVARIMLLDMCCEIMQTIPYLSDESVIRVSQACN